MRPLVDLEVFTPGKYLSTPWIQARKGLLPGMDPDVIDELVLGLERLEIPRAVRPQADEVRLLEAVGVEAAAADVVDADVGDQFVEGEKSLVAGSVPVFPAALEIISMLRLIGVGLEVAASPSDETAEVDDAGAAARRTAGRQLGQADCGRTDKAEVMGRVKAWIGIVDAMREGRMMGKRRRGMRVKGQWVRRGQLLSMRMVVVVVVVTSVEVFARKMILGRIENSKP